MTKKKMSARDEENHKKLRGKLKTYGLKPTDDYAKNRQILAIHESKVAGKKKSLEGRLYEAVMTPARIRLSRVTLGVSREFGKARRALDKALPSIMKEEGLVPTGDIDKDWKALYDYYDQLRDDNNEVIRKEIGRLHLPGADLSCF